MKVLQSVDTIKTLFIQQFLDLYSIFLNERIYDIKNKIYSITSDITRV